jgi:hypothetical protein
MGMTKAKIKGRIFIIAHRNFKEAHRILISAHRIFVPPACP